MSQSSTPVQQVTKLRGGFEVDDDDGDLQDNSLEEAQDDDVYGLGTATDLNGTSHDHGALDRSSKCPAQENGITPVPVQATDSSADLSSSVVSNNAQLQSALTSNGLGTISTDQTSVDPLSALPKSRLAHDVVGMLEDRVKDDPRGDTAAWLELIEEYKSRNKDDLVRKTYERYLEIFPLAVRDLRCILLRCTNFVIGRTVVCLLAMGRGCRPKMADGADL